MITMDDETKLEKKGQLVGTSSNHSFVQPPHALCVFVCLQPVP